MSTAPARSSIGVRFSASAMARIAVLAGAVLAAPGWVWADETPRKGDRASASASRPRSSVVRVREPVAAVREGSPVFQLVPPCREAFFPYLLGCLPPAVHLLPPQDLAVQNALHGIRVSPEPVPTLFSW